MEEEEPLTGDTPGNDEDLQLTGLNDTKRQVTYGILGCAGIASKVVRAIHMSPFAKALAVASRELDRAESFCRRNCPDAKRCTYEELINNKDIDVIYIPLPTSLKLPWIIKAIEKKKHILCEKPIGSPRAVEIIIPSCEVKQVQFMDGIQWMHHPRFKQLTKYLHHDKKLGKIKRINSSLSVPCLNENNIRNQPELEPLGVLGDLGTNNIRLSLWAFDYEPPRFIKALCHKRNLAGSMQDISAWIFWSDDRTASFDISYHAPLRQHAEIVGTHGYVELKQFVLPNENRCLFTSHYQTLNTYDCTEYVSEIEFKHCVQEVEMINKMSKIVLNHELEPIWPQLTLMTEKIVDACRRSIDKDGQLVEFEKGQIWFEMSKKENRKFSIVSGISMNNRQDNIPDTQE